MSQEEKFLTPFLSVYLPACLPVCLSACLSQRHGEPLFTQPKPAEQRGCAVQLQDHLAGVRGGSRLLEGPVTVGGYSSALPRHRLLRQRGPAFLHQPAGAGALRAEQGGGR